MFKKIDNEFWTLVNCTSIIFLLIKLLGFLKPPKHFLNPYLDDCAE